MKKRGLDLTLLDDVVDDLRQGKAFDEKYKDHILKGDYSSLIYFHYIRASLFQYVPMSISLSTNSFYTTRFLKNIHISHQ